MNTNTTGRWPLVVGALLVCLPLLFWLRGRMTPGSAGEDPAPRSVIGNVAPAVSASTGAPSPGETLRSLAAALSSVQRPEEAVDVLARVRATLAGLSPQAASEVIRQLLDSGVDAPTRLDFKVGKDGFLAQPPSLRTLLLDELARVDRAAAGRYAEKILAVPTTPDEWALALRNYAWANPGDAGRDYLREKVAQLLRLDAWQSNPSIGYLEAFDAAVYAGGAEVTTALTDLVRKQDNRAVSHAAYLALDRLTLADPAATLALLQQQPSLMEGREATRANYFARAAAGDPSQRALLENYLLDPGLQPQELDTFTGLYPNANFMISPNLLTANTTPDGATLAQRDREALAVVTEWMSDPRFAKLQPQLQKMKSRLEQFVPATNR